MNQSKATFKNELLANERLRVTLLFFISFLLVSGFFIVSSTFPELFAPFKKDWTFFRKFPLVYLTVISFYTTIVWLVVRYCVKKQKVFPHFVNYLFILIESGLISLFIYSTSYLFTPAFHVLFSPPVLLYFIYIALSALKLDFWLSVFSGAIVAIEYILLSLFLINVSNDSLDSSQIIAAPGLHIMKGVFLFLTGLTIGFITHKNKKNIYKSIQAAEKSHQTQVLEKMKSRFYTHLTHEFRTPLTLIQGPVEELLAGTQKPSIRNKLNSIKRNSMEMLNLINQLLEMAKLESDHSKLQLSRGDIIDFAKRITNTFTDLSLQKDIKLSFDSDLQTFVMSFDTTILNRILSNLLSNACKFTPEKGHIIVVLKKNHTPKQSNMLTITVKDSGRGIPSDQLPYIFDQFYRVIEQDTVSGTGIGLALVKELVSLHQGTIRVNSIVGVGSEFVVNLPSSLQIESPIPVVDESINTSIIPNEKVIYEEEDNSETNDQEVLILIIEDNEEMRDFIRGALSHTYRIEVAENGEIGIDKARENIPDLIISDVMMPKKDGYEVCHTLKQDLKTEHIPIILLTAKATLDEKIQGLDTGADVYLTKPFSVSELRIHIQNLITQRKKLRIKYGNELLSRPHQTTMDSPKNRFIQQVNTILEKELANEHFGVEQLGDAMAMSRTQLHRKFRALSDYSAVEFIRSFRLAHALELLKSGESNVTEAAFQTGFSSRTYFTKCFREEFGYLPSQVIDPEARPIH